MAATLIAIAYCPLSHLSFSGLCYELQEFAEDVAARSQSIVKHLHSVRVSSDKRCERFSSLFSRHDDLYSGLCSCCTALIMPSDIVRCPLHILMYVLLPPECIPKLRPKIQKIDNEGQSLTSRVTTHNCGNRHVNAKTSMVSHLCSMRNRKLEIFTSSV